MSTQHDSLAEAANYAIEKRHRAERTARIQVETVMGNVFDGDEVSQSRMARVLLAFDNDRPDGTVQWILADNSLAEITLDELEEALRLSVEAQQAIWLEAAGDTHEH